MTAEGLCHFPGHSWARSDQTVSPWNDRRDICKRPFSFAHQGKLATEQRLKVWSTYSWGNSWFLFRTSFPKNILETSATGKIWSRAFPVSEQRRLARAGLKVTPGLTEKRGGRRLVCSRFMGEESRHVQGEPHRTPSCQVSPGLLLGQIPLLPAPAIHHR